MEETKALKEVENSLRDFITIVMTEEKGEDWIDSCGVSPDRIIQWKERREIEKKLDRVGVKVKKKPVKNDEETDRRGTR